jgi:hypothetical protein
MDMSMSQKFGLFGRRRSLLKYPKVVRKVVGRRLDWSTFFDSPADYFVVFSMPPGRRFLNLLAFPIGGLLAENFGVGFSNLFFLRYFGDCISENFGYFFNRGLFFMFIWVPKSGLFLSYSHICSLESFAFVNFFVGKFCSYLFVIYSGLFVIYSGLLRFFFYAYFWTIGKKS